MVNLEEARSKSGISVKEAANHLDITEEHLNLYERNPSSMSIMDAVNLTELYKVNIKDILF